MKTEKEQFEDQNKLITEFMGYHLAPCNNGLAWDFGKSIPSSQHPLPIQGMLLSDSHYKMKYKTSWDWLMPVVEKINEIGYAVLIGRISCNISEVLDRENPIASMVCGDVSRKMEIVFDSICQFINWYNKQKK